jgi:hypothetical protein
MSEFLFIIPEGWTRIDIQASGMSAETIQCSSMQTITEMLRIAGLIGEQDIVNESRVFDGEVFLIKLA